MVNMTSEQLRRLARTLLEAAGTPNEVAATVAESLVESNLMGHDSHGVMRLLDYAPRVKSGLIRPDAKPEIVRESPGAAVVDGRWNFGQIVARFAMQVAVGKARRGGVAAVTTFHTNHVGRLGEYAAMAADHGYIGLALANSIPIVAPYGGRGRALGTNPIAFAVPGFGRPMLLADFSTAMIPEGKVRMARDKRERLPMGLILDKEGNATADPNDFYNGGMLQCFAGHKGYALALMVEVLSGCLSGAYDYTGQDRGNGLFLLAIDPAGYDLPSAFTGHLDRLLGKIKAVSPAPGFAEVFLPGEPEMISRTLRLLHGIEVPADTWNELKKLAGEFSVDADQVVA